uniref:E5 n=1 Tax=Human papillomavirus type 94 TaxID=260717 RepID=E7BQ69_HPV94|nr:E5 [Human papillomavirus 94]
MYPLILRDQTGDHPVLLFEPGDVYLLLCLILFVLLALFVLYRHLGVL